MVYYADYSICNCILYIRNTNLYLYRNGMDKYELNNRIYKCIQWQQNNKTYDSKFGKCVVDPNKVKEWNPAPPKPVKILKIKKNLLLIVQT